VSEHVSSERERERERERELEREGEREMEIENERERGILIEHSNNPLDDLKHDTAAVQTALEDAINYARFILFACHSDTIRQPVNS